MIISALSGIRGHTIAKILNQHPKVTTADGLKKTEVSIFTSNRGNQQFSLENNHFGVPTEESQKPGENKQERRHAVEEMQKLMLFSHNLSMVR